MDTTALAAVIGAALAAVPGSVTIAVLIFRHGREMARLRADVDNSATRVEFVELRASVEANTATCRRHEDEIGGLGSDLSKAKSKIWKELEKNDRG